jgi:hypothetical protein
VTPEEAPGHLRRAIARRNRAAKVADEAWDACYQAVREVAPYMKQMDIAEMTGWRREHVRNIVNGLTPKPADEAGTKRTSARKAHPPKT